MNNSTDNNSGADLQYPDENNELVCLILDLSPLWWTKAPDGVILNYTDAIVAFSIMYLALSTKKELAIIGVVPERSEYIYTMERNVDKITPFDCKVRLFQSMESSIRKNIAQMINHSHTLINTVNMSGALIKSLCYYNQRQRFHNMQSVHTKVNGRLIIIRTNIPDSSSCFMSMMNGIFTAQKLNICIDVCLLEEMHSGPNQDHESDKTNILRQSVDMTNGIYLRINKLGHLYQNLATLFLPDVDDRKYMTMIAPTNIDTDFRASCFCHGRLISMGYVCSLCLAVYCRYSPLCKCCFTVFQDKKLKFNTES